MTVLYPNMCCSKVLYRETAFDGPNDIFPNSTGPCREKDLQGPSSPVPLNFGLGP